MFILATCKYDLVYIMNQLVNIAIIIFITCISIIPHLQVCPELVWRLVQWSPVPGWTGIHKQSRPGEGELLGAREHPGHAQPACHPVPPRGGHQRFCVCSLVASSG